MIYNNLRVPATEVTPLTYKREDGIVAWMDRGGSNVAKLAEQMPGVIKLIATADPNHKDGRGVRDNKAAQRAQELGVPVVPIDFVGYEQMFGIERGDYARAMANGPSTNFVVLPITRL